MFRTISGLLLALGGIAWANEQAPSKSNIRVECHGQLRHGVVAIGGETTGTTIGFDRTTLELRLPDDVCRKFAADHHKKHVVAVGSLRRVCGTTIPVRWIVDVERLDERKTDSSKPGAIATVTGHLKNIDAPSNDTGGLAVEADGVSWPLVFADNNGTAAETKTLVNLPVIVTGRVDSLPETKPVRLQIRVENIRRLP